MFDIAYDILGIITNTCSIESSLYCDIHISCICSSQITHTRFPEWPESESSSSAEIVTIQLLVTGECLIGESDGLSTRELFTTGDKYPSCIVVASSDKLERSKPRPEVWTKTIEGNISRLGYLCGIQMSRESYAAYHTEYPETVM